VEKPARHADASGFATVILAQLPGALLPAPVVFQGTRGVNWRPMLCTWLLTTALVAGRPVAQEIEPPRPMPVPSLTRPVENPVKNKDPFGRLFPISSDDARAEIQARLWRSTPGKRMIRANGEARPAEDEVEIICGLTVVRKSADVDPAIVMPATRGTNPAVRRIEPDVCRSAR
jgi:hypothetical protein